MNRACYTFRYRIPNEVVDHIMPNTNNYPRLLILGNSCLSKTNSNGRTLQNFLAGWPADKLAQFFVKNHAPDFSVCKRYFRVTDMQALKAFLGKRAEGRIITEAEIEVCGIKKERKRSNRNPATMLLREMIWNSRRWQKCGFMQWVDQFSPEIILLQAGDSGFMLRLARSLAKKYNIPLVIYNSEAYYFKKHNYFRHKGLSQCFYPLFRHYFRKEMTKTLSIASCAVYIHEDLKKLYDQEFSLPSVCIHTATELQPLKYIARNRIPKVTYLGNMGVGRHEQLVELANVLQQVCPEAYLDVYGSIPNKDVKNAFTACPGIRHYGMISYDEVLRTIRESDILVHVENFSDFYKKDSAYAFSTKIADSLASGICFLLYAPKELSCTKYLLDNNAAYVATDKMQLTQQLIQLCNEPDSRFRYLPQAAALARKNHSSAENTVKFQKILLSAWKNT